jgi:hypothetical protein
MIKTIQSATILLKHKMRKLGDYAFKKPRPKKRTGDPMIKTDNYWHNSIVKNSKDQIKSPLKFKKRRELLKKKNEFGVMVARKWNKASPIGKVGYVGAAIAPKALLVGGGYFLAGKDNKEK